MFGRNTRLFVVDITFPQTLRFSPFLPFINTKRPLFLCNSPSRNRLYLRLDSFSPFRRRKLWITPKAYRHKYENLPVWKICKASYRCRYQMKLPPLIQPNARLLRCDTLNFSCTLINRLADNVTLEWLKVSCFHVIYPMSININFLRSYSSHCIKNHYDED